MVPQEGIEKAQPATLPADFGEWDGGEKSEAQPSKLGGFDGYSGSVVTSKPPTKSAAARVAVLPVAGRTQTAASRPPAPAYANVEQAYQPPRSQAVKAGASRQTAEGEGKNKKPMMLAIAGGAALVLVLGSVGLIKMRSKPVTPNQPAVSQTAVVNVPKPTPGMSTATPAPAPTAPTAAVPEPEVSPRVQSDAMNKQLNAPSRIPDDLRKLAGRDAPPTSDFGAASAEGLGSGVFSGQAGPKVKVEGAKKVAISAGIAVGLLVQKTTPVYPPIAKSAHVSGTVVIQATISKTGAVENLRVVSGPPMLRQAALNAVKTWRYRPYLLDGAPMEVDTTVNVTFAQAE